MNILKFDMFEQSVLGQVLGTATSRAMVLHPVLFWSAVAAAGAGAAAGLSRAIAERSEFSRGQMFSLEIKAMPGVSPAPEIPLAPVEAPSRPILDNVIDQAIAKDADEPVADATVAADEPCRPAGLEAPRGDKGDDLKLITGIGPKLEMTLNDLGIFHFDQIAAWGDNEARWIDQYLRFRGRVARDRWVEQARELA